ncbi:MAG: divergent polysaccharide deacetylase family protein [Syntrophobacterales bacterium]|nr:divergent polysaccharide deacetylase family protein [Syntrophobacterales bacterium]
MALFVLSLLEKKQGTAPSPPPKERQERRPAPAKKDAHVKAEKKKPGVPGGKGEVSPPPVPLPPEKGRPSVSIAILIDDIGQNMDVLDDLLTINAPLSFAILPHQQYSLQAAEKLQRQKREILLHLPMEPHSFPQSNPGKGALFLRMTDKEIQQQLKNNLQSVPHIIGVNNHMGSRFTENEEKMFVVMEELKKQGLYFVDSRTSGLSKAKKAADRTGIRFMARKIFIDNEQSYETSLQNIMHVKQEIAKGDQEPVLLIGHPYPTTVSSIRDAVPLLREQGIEIVPITKIISP